MMNAARSMWGCTAPMPARLAIERTQRWAVRRSRRLPSWRSRMGPDVRSPMARSIVRAVLGTRGDHSGLVALADDAQGAMPPLEAEVLDVGRARLAPPQAVEAQEHGQGGVGVVDPFGREQEPPEPARSRPRASLGWTLGRRTYWAGLAAMRPSMWAKR